MNISRAVMGIVLTGSAVAAWPIQATAQQRALIAFDQEAQEMGDALREVAARSGSQIYLTPRDVFGRSAPPLKGNFTVEEAIQILVDGSGLVASFSGDAIVIRTAPKSPSANAEAGQQDSIVVTGSRIRGAPPSAPVTTVTQNDMRNAGQSDLGEVARSLPQNFGGGQNPGIGSSQGAADQNVNVNGASTFNLRGIGPNATLTLLNGNRLSYSSTSASIDISAIPATAVDRIEIISDGASAIYGADAVAGVANIILKPDYSGLSMSARIGGSTDGGNFQQQYDLVGGSVWSGGGLIAVYDYFQNDPILAGERSYTKSQNPKSTIYPGTDRHSALISLHQDIGPDITFGTDLVYKTGKINSASGYLTDQPITFQGLMARTQFESFGVAPSLNVDLPANWSAKVNGFYGFDDTSGLSKVYFAGVQTGNVTRNYDNDAISLEASAQGPLFDLPGGDARLAFGGGFRSNKLRAVSSSVDLTRKRDNYFAYGEIFLPLIGPMQDISFLHRLSLTGAVRYEHYSGVSDIASPKAALIYEPIEAISLTASWGRSFKLPTLYQQYAGYAAVLVDVSGYGAAFPAGSTYLAALGANEDQKPERSESWVFSAEVRPLHGVDISASYFRFDYSDRVAPPLVSTAGALTNPIYADLITLNPSAAEIDKFANGALGGLQNASSGPFDAAKVVAILDARDRNLARQVYRGFDMSVLYSAEVGRDQTLALTAAGTWLSSSQQLIAGLPKTDLAGTIFNPPRFKARGGAVLSSDQFSIASFLNYAGGVEDNRQTTVRKISSVTTVDLTGRFKFAHGFEVAVNSINILNAKPDSILTDAPFDTPFDTTNYSATGRYLGISLSKTW